MYVVLKEVEYSHIDNTYSYQYQSEDKLKCEQWISSRLQLNTLEGQKEKYTIFNDKDTDDVIEVLS